MFAIQNVCFLIIHSKRSGILEACTSLQLHVSHHPTPTLSFCFSVASSHCTLTLQNRMPICSGVICDIIQNNCHILRQAMRQRHFVPEAQKEGSTQDSLSSRWNSAWELKMLVSKSQGFFCSVALGVSQCQPGFGTWVVSEFTGQHVPRRLGDMGVGGTQEGVLFLPPLFLLEHLTKSLSSGV